MAKSHILAVIFMAIEDYIESEILLQYDFVPQSDSK